jgi:hypothetical protein
MRAVPDRIALGAGASSDISSRRAPSAGAARSPGNGAFTMIGESTTLAAVAAPNDGGGASAARHALAFA